MNDRKSATASRIIGLALIAVSILFGGILSATSLEAREIVYWDGREQPGTIVVVTSERRLYYILGAGEAISYPIAVGRPGRLWTGTTRVTGKARNPGWTPTPRMRRENPRLPAYVPPGPRNPMGVRAIYLADATLRIHGTNDPSSIGRAASAGCFRMYNQDVTHLYTLVDVGATVQVRR